MGNLHFPVVRESSGDQKQLKAMPCRCRGGIRQRHPEPRQPFPLVEVLLRPQHIPFTNQKLRGHSKPSQKRVNIKQKRRLSSPLRDDITRFQRASPRSTAAGARWPS